MKHSPTKRVAAVVCSGLLLGGPLVVAPALSRGGGGGGVRGSFNNRGCGGWHEGWRNGGYWGGWGWWYPRPPTS